MDDWDHRIRLRELFTGALPGHWGKGLSSSSDETTPGYCVQFWASQHSKDVAKWAGSAEGPYAGRGQHHLHCEHRLREWGLFKPGENVSTRRPKGSLLTHTRGFWRTQSWAIYGGAHWDSEMQQTLKKKYMRFRLGTWKSISILRLTVQAVEQNAQGVYTHHPWRFSSLLKDKALSNLVWAHKRSLLEQWATLETSKLN